jgi:carboxypeptidase T
MKRITVILSIVIVGMFVFSSSGAASWWKTSTDDVLQDVRDQRLNELTNPVPLVNTNGLYHTYDEMTVLLQSLVENHSDILSFTSLGTTYEGRDLWMVKLSDNVDQEEDEPGVLLMGAHHGNEKPSYEVLIYFLLFMIENYENNTNGVREVINNTQIFIVPMVNPDGVEAGTRKNREPNHGPFGFQKNETSVGVDLNRNYGHRWFLLFFFPRLYLGATDYHDISEVYRGERPFSEAETQAIRGFIETHKITICITYHTYGELVLYPWGFTTLPVKDQPVFVSIGENITRINNYTFSQSIGLYPTLGDACDWLYARHDVLAFTIELGKNQAPSDPEVLAQICSTHADVNLYVCQRAESL